MYVLCFLSHFCRTNTKYFGQTFKTFIFHVYFYFRSLHTFKCGKKLPFIMEKIIETIQSRVNELANDTAIQAHILSLDMTKEQAHDYLIKAAIATLIVSQADRVK